MMLILRDDKVLEVFKSPQDPPAWIEAIDVMNGEYSFSDERGQKFIGVEVKKVQVFKPGSFDLCSNGDPNIINALSLVDQAKALESNVFFADLASLRKHLTDTF